MKITLLCNILFACTVTAHLISFDEIPECRGNTYLVTGEFSRADSLFRSIEYEDSTYFYLKMGELRRREGDIAKAMQYLDKVILTDSPYKPFAFRRMGDIYVDQEEWKRAILYYREAAHYTDIESYRFFLFSKIDSLAQAHEHHIGRINWILHWRRLVHGEDVPIPEKTNWPVVIRETGITGENYHSNRTKAVAESSLRSYLQALDTTRVQGEITPDTAFHISKDLMEQGLHRSASRWLHYALRRDDFSRRVTDKEYLHHRTLLNYHLENWSNTLRWGREYYENHGNNSEILYRMARSYRSLGNQDAANEWYNKHVSYYPTSARSHSIIWYMAWQKENRGDFDAAREAFAEIRNTTPDRRFGDDAAFRVGLLHFRTGNYEKAIEEYQTFCRQFRSSPLYPGGYYWIGRSYAALEDRANAEKYYERAISTDPTHYYAWIARKELETEELSFDTTDRWKQRLNRQGQGSTAPEENARFEHALRLGSLGFSDETYFIIEPLTLQSGTNHGTLLSLSDLYMLMEEYHESYRIMRNLYYRVPLSIRRDAPRGLLERYYPQVYPFEISLASAQFSVSPYLIPAIMRQESTFHETIGSPVGALGLMQIMPATGQQIARELGRPFSRNMLFNPVINIDFGTYYIAKRLEQWDGSKVKALASYNGGAHNVQRWVRRNEAILDDEYLFVEFIAFSETRDYVKKVLGNYWTYRALYGERDPS
ncbi:transglycosylase SLT domain-containing protein [Chitinivibrio alkaliphilus]|uniref:Lytic transglycosylase n=1 Tax=Chitinivibrio alkaliphilus ACht1 TaxID=1313304 RepID=U7D676_9BACT|nr:transglycosylase SLT domain-containing protein [Chitinivibrio alkaliphilus]ERP31438.1 lytic transglycosylase [Chitinivibrio alkaliphilus ACht1]